MAATTLTLKSNAKFNFKISKKIINQIKTYGSYIFDKEILYLMPNDNFYVESVEFILSLILTIETDETPNVLVISQYHDIWKHILVDIMIETPFANIEKLQFEQPSPEKLSHSSDIIILDMQPDNPMMKLEAPVVIYVCEVAKLKTPPKTLLCKCIKQIYNSDYKPEAWRSSELFHTLTVSDRIQVINPTETTIVTHELEEMEPETTSEEKVVIKSGCQSTFMDEIIDEEGFLATEDDFPPALQEDEKEEEQEFDDKTVMIPYENRSKDFNSIICWNVMSDANRLEMYEEYVEGVESTINTLKMIMVASEELEHYANTTRSTKKYFQHIQNNGYMKLKERFALEYGRQDVIYLSDPRDLHVAVKRVCHMPVVVIIYKNIHELNTVYSAFDKDYYHGMKSFGGINFTGKQMNCASVEDIMEMSELTGNKLKSFAISASNLVRAAVYTKLLNNMNVNGRPSKPTNINKVNLTVRLCVALSATQAKHSALHLIKATESAEDLKFDYEYFLQLTTILQELYSKAVDAVYTDILKIILSPKVCRQVWNGIPLKKEWLYFGAVYEIYTYTNYEKESKRDISSEMPSDFHLVPDRYKSAYLTMWMIKKSTVRNRCAFTVTKDKSSGILSYVLNDGKMVIVGAYGLRVADLLELLFENNVKNMGYITPLSLAPNVIAHQISIAAHRLEFNSFVEELSIHEPIGYISYYSEFKFISQREVSREDIISSLNIVS